ncbi:DNA topoisomerase [Vibrio breoganii]|uniref:DNA topoisomerase n=1 Tax=Vibrio breoganii TaxID=553239 RepID=UPI0039AF4FC0
MFTVAKRAHKKPTKRFVLQVVDVKSEDLNGVDADAHKLYSLIWNQFVACQMTPAQYDSTTVSVKADEYTLKAKGRILKFDGWTRVQRPMGKNEDTILSAVQIGVKLDLIASGPSNSTSLSHQHVSLKLHWLKN